MTEPQRVVMPVNSQRPLHPRATAFINHLQQSRRYQPASIRAYVYDLYQCLDTLTPVGSLPLDPTAVASTQLAALVKDLEGLGYKPGSIQRKLSCLRTLGKYLESTGTPCPVLRGAPRPKNFSPTRGLTTAQIEQLLSTPVAESFQERRNAALVACLCTTGLKLQELVSLNLADCDLDGGCIRIAKLPEQPRVVPLEDRTRAALRRYLTIRARVPHGADTDDGTAVFLTRWGYRMSRRSIRRGCWRHGLAAGAKVSVNARTMRAGLASALLNLGTPVAVVAERLGIGSMPRYFPDAP